MYHLKIFKGSGQSFDMHAVGENLEVLAYGEDAYHEQFRSGDCPPWPEDVDKFKYLIIEKLECGGEMNWYVPAAAGATYIVNDAGKTIASLM